MKKTHRGFIIKGEAGYGKSVLADQCYWQLLEGNFRYAGLPLLLKLRKWAHAGESFENYLAKRVCDSWKFIDLMKELEKYGLVKRLWLFLDGFDEINEGQRREVEQFFQKVSFSYIVFTRDLAQNPSLPSSEILRITRISKDNVRRCLQSYHRKDILKHISSSNQEIFNDERTQ